MRTQSRNLFLLFYEVSFLAMAQCIGTHIYSLLSILSTRKKNKAMQQQYSYSTNPFNLFTKSTWFDAFIEKLNQCVTTTSEKKNICQISIPKSKRHYMAPILSASL